MSSLQSTLQYWFCAGHKSRGIKKGLKRKGVHLDDPGSPTVEEVILQLSDPQRHQSTGSHRPVALDLRGQREVKDPTTSRSSQGSAATTGGSSAAEEGMTAGRVPTSASASASASSCPSSSSAKQCFRPAVSSFGTVANDSGLLDSLASGASSSSSSSSSAAAQEGVQEELRTSLGEPPLSGCLYRNCARRDSEDSVFSRGKDEVVREDGVITEETGDLCGRSHDISVLREKKVQLRNRFFADVLASSVSEPCGRLENDFKNFNVRSKSSSGSSSSYSATSSFLSRVPINCLDVSKSCRAAAHRSEPSAISVSASSFSSLSSQLRTSRTAPAVSPIADAMRSATEAARTLTESPASSFLSGAGRRCVLSSYPRSSSTDGGWKGSQEERSSSLGTGSSNYSSITATMSSATMRKTATAAVSSGYEMSQKDALLTSAADALSKRVSEENDGCDKSRMSNLSASNSASRGDDVHRKDIISVKRSSTTTYQKTEEVNSAFINDSLRLKEEEVLAATPPSYPSGIAPDVPERSKSERLRNHLTCLEELSQPLLNREITKKPSPSSSSPHPSSSSTSSSTSSWKVTNSTLNCQSKAETEEHVKPSRSILSVLYRSESKQQRGVRLPSSKSKEKNDMKPHVTEEPRPEATTSRLRRSKAVHEAENARLSTNKELLFEKKQQSSSSTRTLTDTAPLSSPHSRRHHLLTQSSTLEEEQEEELAVENSGHTLLHHFEEPVKQESLEIDDLSAEGSSSLTSYDHGSVTSSSSGSAGPGGRLRRHLRDSQQQQQIAEKGDTAEELRGDHVSNKQAEKEDRKDDEEESSNDDDDDDHHHHHNHLPTHPTAPHPSLRCVRKSATTAGLSSSSSHPRALPHPYHVSFEFDSTPDLSDNEDSGGGDARAREGGRRWDAPREGEGGGAEGENKEKEKKRRFGKRILPKPLRRSQSAGCAKDVPVHALFLQHRLGDKGIDTLEERLERALVSPTAATKVCKDQDRETARRPPPPYPRLIHKTASADAAMMARDEYGNVACQGKGKKSLAKTMKRKLLFLRRRHTDTTLGTVLTGDGKLVTKIRPDDAMQWSKSFESLLKDQTGLEMFRNFLRSEFSDENLEFWIAVEEFKQVKPGKVAQAAQKIYTDFVAPQARREINLDSKTRMRTLANLNEPSKDVFEEAQRKIQALMERDSYTRFLESEAYQRIIRSQKS